MCHSAVRPLVVVLLLSASTAAFASDPRDSDLVAPSQAVAAAWAQEARSGPASKTLTALQSAFLGLQGADLWTTIAARNNGARELNPLMDGAYARGAVVKAALSTVTILASRAAAKKNKKAAIFTMYIINGATAAVVLTNVRNAKR